MARIPGGKSASTGNSQSRKPTTDSRKVRASKSAPPSLQASKPAGLDSAALGDVIEELRGIEHVLGTASPLMEQARQIAFTMICDHPEQRDALARLGHRLTGGDIDRIGPHNLRLIDDDLLDGVIQAADAAIDAARWRLDRLRCVLVRCAETSTSRKVEKST